MENKELSAFDMAGKIIAYENGELSEDEVIDLFQQLVDTGLLWSLQGWYIRRAEEMLKKGIITR